MSQNTLQDAKQYVKAHQKRKRWQQVVTAMACVVVFCTVYALILPAITMEKGCTLDLGAVGKGIGCDVAKEYLDGQEEVTGAVISIGGSILVYGHKPDESPWKVAVRDPEGAGGDAMGYLSLDRTACVSTSGDYEKYFIEDQLVFKKD